MKRSRLIATALGALSVMFVIGYLFAVRVLFPPLPKPKNGIVVPRLTGLEVSAAQERLRGLGLRLTETIELAHPTQPRGTIVAQSPLPGQQLRNLGAVRVGVSAGVPTDSL
jgi:beta-lactam-binding protein with PASTA domain